MMKTDRPALDARLALIGHQTSIGYTGGGRGEVR